MKRGEIWTLRDDGYASKSRPVLIVQSDEVNAFDSVVLCLFTTYDSNDIATRVFVATDADNGLHKDSFVMTEKIVTVAKNELGERIGRASPDVMQNVSQQLMLVLGITEDEKR